MKIPRCSNLCWWFSGLYLAWALFVYFGSLGSQSHSWWPIFLYPLIYPWSWLEHSIIQPQLESWLVPDPRTAPDSEWMMMDYFGGAFYIVVGSLWFWFIGKVVSRVLSNLKPSAAEQSHGADGGNADS